MVYFLSGAPTQQRHFQDLKAQLEREVALLNDFDRKEREAHAKALQEIEGSLPSESKGDALASAFKAISESIDAEASRRFSVYASGARTNGYSFQAHLVEKKALPPVSQALHEISTEARTFEATVSKDVMALIPNRWQWRKMAQKVNKADEYDYVYSFSSRLLHATPASITTDHKNLEYAEMEVFLRYIDVTIGDIVELASEYCHEDLRAG